MTTAPLTPLQRAEEFHELTKFRSPAVRLAAIARAIEAAEARGMEHRDGYECCGCGAKGVCPCATNCECES